METGEVLKPLTKTQLVDQLAQETGASKQQVKALLDGLTAKAAAEVKRCGAFSLPGLVKLKAVKKPAVPERKGINPFTKTETTFKAKPARTVAKASVLKSIKDAVAS